MPVLFAQASTTGISIATTGVLFKNADAMVTGNMIRNWADATLFGLPFSNEKEVSGFVWWEGGKNEKRKGKRKEDENEKDREGEERKRERE